MRACSALDRARSVPTARSWTGGLGARPAAHLAQPRGGRGAHGFANEVATVTPPCPPCSGNPTGTLRTRGRALRRSIVEEARARGRPGAGLPLRRPQPFAARLPRANHPEPSCLAEPRVLQHVAAGDARRRDPGAWASLQTSSRPSTASSRRGSTSAFDHLFQGRRDAGRELSDLEWPSDDERSTWAPVAACASRSSSGWRFPPAPGPPSASTGSTTPRASSSACMPSSRLLEKRRK